MKNILALAAVAFAFAAASAQAASLSFTQVGITPNFAVYIDSQATVFDAMQVTMVPGPGVTFTGLSSGTGKNPGDPNTFRNRVMDADPLDGGKGYLIAGSTVTAATLSYGATNPGGKITSTGEPNNKLFLGNLFIAGTPTTSWANVTVALVNAGDAVGQALNMDIPAVPEPASLGLVSMALVGLAGLRRRQA